MIWKELIALRTCEPIVRSGAAEHCNVAGYCYPKKVMDYSCAIAEPVDACFS